MKLSFTFLLVSLSIDLLCNSIGPSMIMNPYAYYVILGLHAISLIAHAVIVYIIISRTLMFTSGLIFQAFFKLVKFSILAFLFHIGLICGAAAFKIYGFIQSPSNPLWAWESPGYWILFIIQQLFSLLFYCIMIRTGMSLMSAKLYFPTK